MTRKLYDSDCRLGDFMVISDGDKENSPKIEFRSLPDYASAAARAQTFAATHPRRNVFIVQVTGQYRAVPHVFEVHPNEEPSTAIAHRS